jgi:hypothetical protein
MQPLGLRSIGTYVTAKTESIPIDPRTIAAIAADKTIQEILRIIVDFPFEKK